MSEISQKYLTYADMVEEMLARVCHVTDHDGYISPKVHQVLCEVRLAQQLAYGQVEELAPDEGFRRRHRDVTLRKILNASISGAHAHMGNIQVFDKRSGHLVMQASQGFQKPFLDYFDIVERGHAACGVALQSRTRVIVRDVTTSKIFRYGTSLEVLLDSRVRSVQSTPITGARGQLLGIISTHRSIPGRPSLKELHVLDYFAALAGALLEWHNNAGLSSSTPNRVLQGPKSRL